MKIILIPSSKCKRRHKSEAIVMFLDRILLVPAGNKDGATMMVFVAKIPHTNYIAFGHRHASLPIRLTTIVSTNGQTLMVQYLRTHLMKPNHK